MKMTYTNKQLQEAIDGACKDALAAHPEVDDTLALSPYFLPVSWNEEQAARLTLARAFLDNLPELAKLRAACDRMSEQEVLSLSQLRPISEAGPVPEGCVRVTGYCENGSWFLGVDCLMTQDTHFADIHLPSTEKLDPYAELKKAKSEGKQIEVFIEDDEYGPDRWSLKENNSWARPPECYRIKPEPLVTSPEWTPQAGDVVRLKSGGPLMTVGCPIEHTIPSVSCAWFDGTTLCSTPIPTACIELATKEDL